VGVEEDNTVGLRTIEAIDRAFDGPSPTAPQPQNREVGFSIIETIDFHFRILEAIGAQPLEESTALSKEEINPYFYFYSKLFFEALGSGQSNPSQVQYPHRPAPAVVDPNQPHPDVEYRKGYKAGWKHARGGQPFNPATLQGQHGSDYIDGYKHGHEVSSHARAAISGNAQAETQQDELDKKVSNAAKQGKDLSYDQDVENAYKQVAALRNQADAAAWRHVIAPHLHHGKSLTPEKLGGWAHSVEPEKSRSRMGRDLRSVVNKVDQATDAEDAENQKLAAEGKPPVSSANEAGNFHPADFPQHILRKAGAFASIPARAGGHEAGEAEFGRGGLRAIKKARLAFTKKVGGRQRRVTGPGGAKEGGLMRAAVGQGYGGHEEEPNAEEPEEREAGEEHGEHAPYGVDPWKVAAAREHDPIKAAHKEADKKELAQKRAEIEAAAKQSPEVKPEVPKPAQTPAPEAPKAEEPKAEAPGGESEPKKRQRGKAYAEAPKDDPNYEAWKKTVEAFIDSPNNEKKFPRKFVGVGGRNLDMNQAMKDMLHHPHGIFSPTSRQHALQKQGHFDPNDARHKSIESVIHRSKTALHNEFANHPNEVARSYWKRFHGKPQDRVTESIFDGLIEDFNDEDPDDYTDDEGTLSDQPADVGDEADETYADKKPDGKAESIFDVFGGRSMFDTFNQPSVFDGIVSK
jgi:hypothetical protein